MPDYWEEWDDYDWIPEPPPPRGWRRLWLRLTGPIRRWWWRRRGYQVIDMRDSIRGLTPDPSPFLTLLQHPGFKKRAQDATKIDWLEDELE